MQKTVNILEDMPDFETNVKFDELEEFDPDYVGEGKKKHENETKKKSAMKSKNAQKDSASKKAALNETTTLGNEFF